MSGICDRCQRPGRCCGGFVLNNGTWPIGARDMNAASLKEALRNNPQQDVNGDIASLPFEPLRINSRGKWEFWCTAWVKGRCSIYNHRPALCRDFKPYQDNLCWHHDATTAPLVETKPEKGMIL